jgi:carbamate kinase
VPSPIPQEILEIQQIKLLTENGFVVIACGGGGIPVITNEKNYLVGVEAVIDKDLASSLLATDLKAEVFIITTSVDRVALNFNTPDEEWLDALTLEHARDLYAADQFDPGSMGPKILAMINYLENGGAKGIITSPENLLAAVDGNSGTVFTN